MDSQTALKARGAGLEVVPEEGEEEPFPGFATPDTSLHSIPRSVLIVLITVLVACPDVLILSVLQVRDTSESECGLWRCTV